MMSDPKYRRILLKLSGEMLADGDGLGMDIPFLKKVAREVKEVHDLGVQLGVVIGGGNFIRGVNSVAQGLSQISADYMGMVATIINALAIQDFMEQEGLQTRVQTAIGMEQVAEPFIRRRAIRHLEKGRVVIFAAGTGNPNFTTDTAAALRAVDIQAEVILKGTKVDGVYTSDPVKEKKAKKFDQISYKDVINRGLKVMDSTAITLCMENKVPIIVFSFHKEGMLKRIVAGEAIGTIIR